MRISELAQEATTPLTAVKYYQREGLLPAGEKTAPNQTTYDDRHVRRVRLVRALLEVGGLSVAAAREVLAALDADDAPLAVAFAAAQHAMSSPRAQDAAPTPASRSRVAALTAAAGWATTDDNPGLDAAARALDGLGTIDFDPSDEYLDAYLTAAATAARADVQALGGRRDRDDVAELMVVGTVLGDPLFAGLRRLAHEHVTHDLFPAGDHDGPRS